MNGVDQLVTSTRDLDLGVFPAFIPVLGSHGGLRGSGLRT